MESIPFDPETAASTRSSVRRTALTIYGSLAILWLLIPSAVVDWCDDLAEKSPAWACPLVIAASDTARKVETASGLLHLPDLYLLARARIRPLLEP